MKKALAIICLSLYQLANAATHTVTNTNDSGVGSLRQAILDANADTDPTITIDFSIGTGIQTITPLTALPAITVSNVTVDGSTQPGWSIGNPQIVISGATVGDTIDGLVIQATDTNPTTNCVIQDLVINNGFHNGILIEGSPGDINGSSNNAVYGCFIGTDPTGSIAVPNVNGIRIKAFINTDASCNNNIIGGTGPDQRNIISGNKNSGIELIENVNNTVIQNNYIGVDKTGTVAIPNFATGFEAGGIAIFGSLTPLNSQHCVGNIIGGSGAGEGNIISGNFSGSTIAPIFGIILQINCTDTVIIGNYIGVDATGRNALPNDIGIGIIGNYNGYAGAPDNGVSSGTMIGGTTAGSSNIISGNGQYGMYLQNGTINSTIQGNYIGTNSFGDILGNGFSGIITQDLLDIPPNNIPNPNVNNLIQSNIIINNGNAGSAPDIYGVFLDGDSTVSDTLNSILGNSIYNNAGNGIKLANNSNNSQIAPTIASAALSIAGNLVVVTATAPSIPSDSNFRLEFFINDINRNPITEGERFIGAIESIPSGATIIQAFSVPLPSITPGSWISATATNLNNEDGTPGDTSEFSSNVQLCDLTSVIGCC